MMNFAVDDLDGMLARLRRNRAKIDPKVEDYGYGRFAWVMDPEGNRIELWEPAKR
jgi:predicted enzyme related to lactoylglutathione lyase